MKMVNAHDADTLRQIFQKRHCREKGDKVEHIKFRDPKTGERTHTFKLTH